MNKIKRAIRARMKNTGESYSTARIHVLAARGPTQTPPKVELDPTRRDIDAALESYPTLTYRGFGIAEDSLPGELQRQRQMLFTDDAVRQVEQCLAYLALVRKTRTAKPREDRHIRSSYGMKREVERWVRRTGRDGPGSYISNGAFIVAAVIAGVPIHRKDPDFINCLVGVEQDDVRAVDEGKDPREWRKMTRFVKWLFSQAGRDDIVGDLAGDSVMDFEFPRQGNVAAIRKYLSRYGDHVQEAFQAARLEYRSR